MLNTLSRSIAGNTSRSLNRLFHTSPTKMGINNIIRFEHAQDPNHPHKHRHSCHHIGDISTSTSETVKNETDEPITTTDTPPQPIISSSESLIEDGKDQIPLSLSSTSLSSQSSFGSTESYPFQFTRDSTLKDFLRSNRQATEVLNQRNPQIIERSSKGQAPHTLWIGCSDSRVNECIALGCQPGEVFTLRNIANLISYQDFSSMSALQFAIDVLKVKKIVVCGHTDCGGVWASLSSKKIGDVLDHWLTPIRQIRAHNMRLLKSIHDPFERCTKLSELNIINSINQVKKHSSFITASKAGEIEIYGLIYDVKTGYLRELELSNEFEDDDDFHDVFHLNGHGDDHNSH